MILGVLDVPDICFERWCKQSGPVLKFQNHHFMLHPLSAWSMRGKQSGVRWTCRVTRCQDHTVQRQVLLGITLEETTETTRVTQHGSTLSPDPWRASTKPSTSNGSACGLRSLGQQENQKFNMDQSSRDEGPDMPSDKYCDSSATQSSAGYELVVKSCGQRRASTTTSATRQSSQQLASTRSS